MKSVWRELRTHHKPFLQLVFAYSVRGAGRRHHGGWAALDLPLYSRLVAGVLAVGLAGAPLAGWIVVGIDRQTSCVVLASLAMALAFSSTISAGPSFWLTHDYDVLAAKPISPRVYLFARAASAAGQGTVLALVGCFLPIVAVATSADGSMVEPFAVCGAVIAAAVSAAAAALALLAFLAVRGHRAWPEHVAVVLTALGSVVLAIVVFSPLLLWTEGLPQVVGAPFVEFLPPSWHASLIVVARGDAGPRDLTQALLSLLTAAGAVLVFRRLFSEDFAHRLVAAREGGRRRPWRLGGWSYWRDEVRAVVFLCEAELSDARVASRGLLIVATAGLSCLLVWWQSGPPTDPLTTGRWGNVSIWILLVFVLIPTKIAALMKISHRSVSSWPLYCSPTAQMSLVAAAVDVLAVGVLLPLAAGTAAVLARIIHAAAL